VLQQEGLKSIKAGIENTLILCPSYNNRTIDWQRRLELLSSIEIFQNLTIKNIHWLLEALNEETYGPNHLVVKEGT
jgi:hypothetical protein